MNWFYESNGQQRGPVSDAELDQLIAAGQITPATLVWREGLANWQPLHSARPAAAPSDPGAPGALVNPADAARCDACGRTVSRSEIIQIGERSICAACKPAALQQIQQSGAVTASTDGRNGPPWEHREQLGYAKAAWETIKAVLGNPTETFAAMKREGGLGGPLLYVVIIGTISGEIGIFFQFLFRGVGAAAQASSSNLPYGALALSGGFYLCMAVLMPALIALGVFIWAGILHLCLMLCGGANQPFETTFRSYCYAVGSTNVLQLVPVCGALPSLVWGIVASAIALSKTHEITTGKAVLAVLIPWIVCCGLMALLFASIVGLGVAAAHH
jgi:hypothetical protein